MIVLVHENHDKMAKCCTTPTLCSGFDHANLVISFCGSKYLPKIWLKKIKYMSYKDDNIFAYKRKIGNRAHFPNWW